MHSGVTVWGKAIFWHLQLTQKQHTDKRFHCEAVLPDEKNLSSSSTASVALLVWRKVKKKLHICTVAALQEVETDESWAKMKPDSSSRVPMVDILICLGGTTSKHICGYGFKPRAPGWHGKMHACILGRTITLNILYECIIFSIFIIYTTVKI